MGWSAAHAALAVAVASSCGVMNASFAIRFADAVAAAHASIDGGMGIERGLGSISGNHVTSTSTYWCPLLCCSTTLAATTRSSASDAAKCSGRSPSSLAMPVAAA